MIAAILSVALLLEWPFSVRVEPFSGLGAEGKDIGCLKMTSASTLYANHGGFGGYSGLHLDQETGILTLLSDAGHLFRSQATIDEHLAITALGPSKYYKIRVHGFLTARMDTEALVPLGDQWLVTREQRNDAIVVKFDADTETLDYVKTLTELTTPIKLPGNGGFEGAEIIGDDVFVFIPEASDNDLSPIMLYQDDRLIHVADYKVSDGFAVTDLAADVASDRLFILERFFSRATGPKARIKMLPISAVMGGQGETLEPTELGRLSILDGADNMEGMIFEVAEDGSENLVIISDDNYNDIQRTVLMTLKLGPTCP